MTRNTLGKKTASVLAAAAVLIAAGAASAAGLPKTFAWTAYGTTSSGYAGSVAIANALAEDGYKMRVLPAKNDISRMTPLETGRVQFSAMGVGSYLAQEGVLDFGTKAWGPQPVRVLMMAWADTNTALAATAKDAGIRSAADLDGKRVAWVVGGPALNQNMTAWLAYGGLDWDDVTKVEVPGWKASIQGMIDGTIDAAIASTDSSALFQLDGSPRGLHFFAAPHSEKEAWRRLRAHAPWFAPHTATAGIGLSPEKPLEGASYGYPILITYASQDDQMVYEMVKLIDTKHDAYKDAHASGKGWAMERQVFDWIVPYHEGAVRYFKETGVWSPELDAHNQALVARQEVLAKAWNNVKDSDEEGDEFHARWMAERAKALEAAGMDPIWRE